MVSFLSKASGVFAALGRALAWPFLWLRRSLDGEDALFYLGAFLVGYGLWQISKPHSFIVVGVLLMLHAYMPGVKEMIIDLFAPAARKVGKR